MKEEPNVLRWPIHYQVQMHMLHCQSRGLRTILWCHAIWLPPSNSVVDIAPNVFVN